MPAGAGKKGQAIEESANYKTGSETVSSKSGPCQIGTETVYNP
jgi:hypothetical protein